MHLRPLELEGAFVVDVVPHFDERGLFARTWSAAEFAECGLGVSWVQCSTSFNARSGTLRGLHYQAEPFPEEKLVRCTSGSVFDVIVDLRKASETFGRWVGIELSADNRRGVFIPAGFAHGFQTLEDGTELCYLISETHRPELARGVRWDDPTLAIVWPSCPRRIISERDRALPPLPA